MSMFKQLCAVAAVAISGWAAQAQAPDLGQPVTAAELSAIDFTIMPNGEGLPDGGGDALQGAALYQQHCLACHGFL